MPPSSIRPSKPSSRLIQHDINLERRADASGRVEVTAVVYCERHGEFLDVEECALCDRFGHIEPHEAGYTMLCRSKDELPAR